ncbi:hypothetical protein LEMLEM_LOCUS11274 [Lemmus lemmus]
MSPPAPASCGRRARCANSCRVAGPSGRLQGVPLAMGATLLGIRIRSDCVCLESSLQIIGGCCAGTVVILQTGGRETREIAREPSPHPTLFTKKWVKKKIEGFTRDPQLMIAEEMNYKTT